MKSLVYSFLSMPVNFRVMGGDRDRIQLAFHSDGAGNVEEELVQGYIMGGSEVDQKLVAHVPNEFLPPLFTQLLEACRNDRFVVAVAANSLFRVKGQPFDDTVLKRSRLNTAQGKHIYALLVPGPPR